MRVSASRARRAPNPYSEAVLPGSMPSRVTNRDEDVNPDRSAPLTGNGASVPPVTQPVTLPGRPRRRPTIPSRPAHIAGVSLEGRNISLAPSLDAIVTALRAGNLYVRPLGQFGHEPVVKQVVTPFTATMQSYAFITQAGLYSPTTNTNFFNTTYIDGSSMTVVGSETFNGLSVGVSALMADGWAGTYLTFNIAQPANQLLSLGIQLQFWKDYFRIGGSYIHFNLSSLLFYAVSGLVAVNVTRDVGDLGAYTGPDAEDLAHNHGLDLTRDGLRQIELRQMFNRTMSLRLAGGSFTIAGLGRADYVHGRQTVFRTLVSTKKAQQVVFEGHGLRQYFKDRFRAMGLRREILEIPSQHKPSAFLEGDEVIQTHSNTLTGSAIVGNLTVFAGVQGFRRGDLEIAAHKLDDTHMEVVFSPTRIRDMGTYFFSPFGPEGDIGAGYAMSVRQSFIFDLGEPEALKAYHEAIDGKLPNGLHLLMPTREQLLGKQVLKDSVQAQNAQLPKGVKRNYVHFIRSTEHRGGMGAYWRIIPRVFLPQQWLNILATHRNRVHEVQAISDGKVVDSADNRFSQRRNELLWYGLRTIETAAQRRTVIDDKNKRTFLGLTIESTLYDGCMRRLAGNREFVRRVNRYFEKRYAKFTRVGHKQQREVDVVRMFEPAEVNSLERYARLWAPGETPPLSESERAVLAARLWRCCDETKMWFPTVKRMLTKAAQKRPGNERAAVVQKFVQAHGVHGFALINKLVPEERTLSITTSSSTYANSLKRAARLELQYYEPVRGGDSPETVRQRYKDVNLGLERLERALLDLEDDPFLGPEKVMMRAELEQAREGLVGLLRMDPIEAEPLIIGLQVTKHHFHSSRDVKLIYTLEDPDLYIRQANQLAAEGQDRRLPRTPAALAQRWRETQRVARKLRHRLHWLREPATAVSPDERAERVAQTEAALRMLVGGTHKADLKKSHGLLDLETLDPTERAAARAALPQKRRDRFLGRLRAALH